MYFHEPYGSSGSTGEGESGIYEGMCERREAEAGSIRRSCWEANNWSIVDYLIKRRGIWGIVCPSAKA
jgi:hypothetical protein